MSDLQQDAEGRRQAYLAALGIPLWSPRASLAGALALPPRVFVAWTAAAAVPERETASPSVAATPAAPPAQAPRPVAPPPLQTASGFPRFACRVQELAPGWMAVIALENDAPDLSAREHRLLANLKLALGGEEGAAGQPEFFRWPLSPNPAIPRDAGAAREALAAFLARRGSSGRWLVLGETLAAYVHGALPAQQVAAAPALGELLAMPAAKRRLWQALHG
jgi:hypothetical protein